MTGELGGSGGLGSLSSVNRFAEIGDWIRSSTTGLGHATRPTLLLTELGLTDAQLWRVEILIAAGNDASLRVAQKTGAVLEGRLRNRLLYGRSVDADLLSIVRDPMESPAQEHSTPS
jgi:RimJ/RimL family protein N-acetyltransferase